MERLGDKQILHGLVLDNRNEEDLSAGSDSDESELQDLDKIYSSNRNVLSMANTNDDDRHVGDFFSSDDESVSDNCDSKIDCFDEGHGVLQPPQQNFRSPGLQDAAAERECLNDDVTEDYELRGCLVSREEPWLVCKNENKFNKLCDVPFTGPTPGAYVAVERPPLHPHHTQSGHQMNQLPVQGPAAVEWVPNPKIQGQTPFAVFLLYFQEILEKLCVETNRSYQRHVLRTGVNQHYGDITLDHMKRFFAIYIETGHVARHNLRDYWSTDERKNCPWFNRTLSSSIFGHILRYFYFTSKDPPTASQRSTGTYDRLWKIRDILQLMQDKSQQLYNPCHNLSVGEVVSAFNGRAFFSTYYWKKRQRYGVKLYKLADSSSYTVAFTVYVGQTDNLHENEEVTQRTLLDLLKGYEGFGHRVYMNSLFTSLQLFRQLRQVGILACGTAQPTRDGMPVEFHKAHERGIKLLPYELACRVTLDGITCIKYREKKTVTMLSTIHPPHYEGCYAVSEPTTRGGVTFATPLMVCDYNRYMSVMDVSDQLMCGYPMRRHTRRWTVKLFFQLFETLLLNSFIAYKSVNQLQRGQTFRWYRDQVIEGLVLSAPTGASLRRAHVRNQNLERLQGSEGRHFPYARTTKLRIKCAVCSANKKRTDTRIFCRSCEVALCPFPCFEQYHTCQDLSRK